MLNFLKKEKYIKTNPENKPSVRLSNVILNKLEKEEYRFLKSKNEFVKDFEFGRKVIRLSYNSSFGYISDIECFVYIVFTDVEKQFKKILPKFNWTNWTLCNNMDWECDWLCDTVTGEYTDKSIHPIASSFFNSVKPKIDLLFDNVNNYSDLNKIYNINPDENKSFVRFLRIDKKIINALIVAKHIDKDNFREYKIKLKKEFREYLGSDQDEMAEDIKKAILYLENNEVEL